MAGYDDTRNKILESLLQRPVGTEINPENHQDFALSLLDYIRSVELISGSTLIGIAYQDTVPVQSNNSNGVYIAGVAQGSTVVFQNFRDVNGNQLTVTTEDTESKLVILIWNRQYWSKHEISANVVSQAENAYYNLTIRKQYESVNAMNSDKKSPIGNDGRAIRRGEIVSVRNPSNSNENGLYSYELNEYKIPYWQLQTKLSTLADRIIDGGGASGRLDLIKNRRDTNENWEEQNPVLAEGEIGFVVDKNYYKIGDGVSSWKNLQRIGYYDVDINNWLEYDRKNIYSLQEGAGCLQFDGFTEVTGLGGIINTKDSYRYKVLYSTTSKSFILSVVDESDGIGKKVGNFLFWPEIKTETKTIPSSESYKRRDVLFYIFTPNVGSVYYYIDDDGNASEKSSTYIIKKQLDSVKNSIIKKATVEYYDSSVIDGPDRINTRANIKFLDANDNQLFNAVLFGAGNGYPGLLSLKNKTKLDNYADTFVTNPVASSESNGLMSVAHVNKIEELGERVLQYLYPKIYQLNEGAGAREFDGFYSGNASVTDVRKTEATDGCSYKVVFVRGKFHLQEISPGGVTISLYSEWDRLGDIASSESYAERDKLYYIYVAGEGSTYYYIDSNGDISEKSATYLLRLLLDKNAAEAKEADAAQATRLDSMEAKVGNYPEQFVLDLGTLNSQSEGERVAARSEVAGNRNISFIRFQVQGVSELKTTLIMQWPNGINETAQIMCVDKAQWRRNVTGATGVVGAPTRAYNWERTAPHSIVYDEQRRIIQLKDYQRETVSQGVELPLAMSSKPGLMSSADKTKLDNVDIAAIQAKNLEQDNRLANAEKQNTKQNERLLNYVYPKLYQINEGAGASPFDGMYIGSASVLSGRKTAAEEGYTYKVVFALGKFLLQEISPGGVTVGLYEEWDKIISGRGSSEDYAQRDRLYYIFEPNEGSTYYYIDSNGVASEQSATYLLRRLVNKNASEIATLQGKDAEQDERLYALENPPAPDYVEMLIEADTAKHYRLFYDVRCIGWLEIDGEEAELPVITEDRAASFYAVLSQGRHVVRFRPKEGNMADGTPYKEREGLLAWCADNCVTEITLPEGWKVINSKMFEGAATLRRVNLPSTITDVRYGAFGGCRALEEIVLPPSVKTIGHIIAHDCPALKRIVLGGGDKDITATGTLAQSCAALECVEFRAGGTVAFSGSANTFINLPQLARFIVRGNFPTFECSQPFTSSGYVGSGAAAEVRWIFTADGEEETLVGKKWRDLIRYCGFTVKKALSYTLL